MDNYIDNSPQAQINLVSPLFGMALYIKFGLH